MKPQLTCPLTLKEKCCNSKVGGGQIFLGGLGLGPRLNVPVPKPVLFLAPGVPQEGGGPFLKSPDERCPLLTLLPGPSGVRGYDFVTIYVTKIDYS